MTGNEILELQKQILIQNALYQEQQIRLVMNDKPKWIPKKLWHKLIQLVIKMEYLK